MISVTSLPLPVQMRRVASAKFDDMNYDSQSRFWHHSACAVSQMKRRHTKGNISPRHPSVIYYNQLINDKIRICQNIFRYTLKITPRFTENKFLQKITPSLQTKIRRGKCCKRPHKMSENVIALIRSATLGYFRNRKLIVRGEETVTFII